MSIELKFGRFHGPYLNFRETVRDLLVAERAYAGPRWFETQHYRLSMAYLHGESAEVCALTLAEFGRHAMVRKTKTPRELAVRVVRVTA